MEDNKNFEIEQENPDLQIQSQSDSLDINKEFSAELPQPEKAIQQDASISTEDEPVTKPPTIIPDPAATDTEKDFVLDPQMLGEIPTETERPIGRWQVVPTQPTEQYSPETSERVIDPIPPIMPKITQSEYHPVEKERTSRGMRVFAVIVAVMVLLSAAVAGGYFLGISRSGSNQVKVDLAKKPSAKDALTASEVYKKANPSVVGIYIYNDKGLAGTASGVIYSEDGYVVTNDHIYSDVAAAQFKVYTHDGKMLSASYVAGDTRSDLAVLKIENASGLKPATFGNSAESVVGEVVIAVGRPNGATEQSTASEGIISATSRRISTTSSYNGRFIQTDSAINPGSSGGALCNLYGQVIGITSAKLVGDEYEGVGFAIPTTVMKPIVESLIKNKKVIGRARLGISYQEVTPLTAEMTKSPAGLLIAEIDKSSDLYGKSVGEGDTITHINGTEIIDADLVLDIIEQSKPGTTLNLRVYSAEKKKSIDISVKLLEDTGSSSYVAKESGSSKQEYNSSAFDFPNGD